MDNGTLQTDPVEILKELRTLLYPNFSGFTEDSKQAASSILV